MNATMLSRRLLALLFLLAVSLGTLSTVSAQSVLPTGQISGLVTRFGDNQPEPGATVHLFLKSELDANPDAAPRQSVLTTDPVTTEDGYVYNYRFDAVEAGEYVVRTFKQGFFGSSPPQALVTVAEGQESQNVNFQLFPPGSLSGRAIRSNQPLKEVTVHLFLKSDLDANPDAAPRQSVLTTDPVTTEDGYVYNYRFDNLAPDAYVVRADREGLNTDPRQREVTVTSANETRDVNFFLLPLAVYGAGLQLIATPYDYSDREARSIFGLTPGTPSYDVFSVADWLPETDDYNTSPDIRLVRGKGYFVRFGEPATVEVRGGAIDPNTQSFHDIALSAGWNLIGNPFDPRTDQTGDGSIALARMMVFVAGSPNPNTPSGAYTLSEAAAAGYVRDVAFSYTGSSAGSQYVQQFLLRPWVGYWFRAFQPVTLRMAAPSASGRASRVGSGKTITRDEVEAARFRSITSKGVNDWRLQIAARQGDLLDTDNSIGVAPEARDGFDFRHDTEKPPMIGQAPSVYLALTGTNEKGRAAPFADDIRAADGSTKVWEFTVRAGGSGDVTLFWPNINRLPRNLSPILVDVQTGRRVNMRSSGSTYRFTPDGRATRSFRIEVAPPASRPLALLNVKINGGGRAAATSSYRFSFTATQEADVQAEVQTIGGKVVRRLQTRAVAARESSLAWDGRSASGDALPAGPYVLKLTAKDSNGNLVRAQRPLLLLR